jgi:hypothetical protein
MPRTEGRLKSLFWPSVNSSSDVDYLGAQGYWVCLIVGCFSCVVLAFRGLLWVGVFVLAFYFLGGVGVRERSRYAAICVFLAYLGDTIFSPSIVSVILCGLLLSNLRATWIASRWSPGSVEGASAPRWNQSWTDKLVDQLPPWLWPKVRHVYYVLAVLYLGIMAIGLASLLKRLLAA